MVVAAEQVVAALGGKTVVVDAIAEFAQAAGARPGPIVVVLGRTSLAESTESLSRAAAALLQLPEVRFLVALRRGNVRGALELGCAPGFLPGSVSLDAAREWFGPTWQRVPAQRGLDAAGILRAAADGKIRVLVLLGTDPITDFPDADLARRALDGAAYVVAVDAFFSESTRQANAFLPCTVWGEKGGTTTNLEGRVQRLGRKVPPEGTTMDDWRIAGELALRLGDDFDLEFVDEVTDEIARVAPAHLGASAALLRRARDGVVLPLREHLDEIMVRTRDLNILSEDGHAVSWDPIRADAVIPAGSTAAVEGAGAGGTSPITPEAGDPGDDPEAAVQAVETARNESDRAQREAPALHEWDRVANSIDAPGRDAYALRLVTQHVLYDGGRIVSCSPALSGLRSEIALLVHPHDLANIGVGEGDAVRVMSSRATVTLPVRTDPRVPMGVAALPFGADGKGAAELIDVATMVTDLRIETIGGGTS